MYIIKQRMHTLHTHIIAIGNVGTRINLGTRSPRKAIISDVGDVALIRL